MADSDRELSEEEIKNNEEYALGNRAGLESNFFGDFLHTFASTDSIWDKGYDEGRRQRDRR